MGIIYCGKLRNSENRSIAKKSAGGKGGNFDPATFKIRTTLTTNRGPPLRIVHHRNDHTGRRLHILALTPSESADRLRNTLEGAAGEIPAWVKGKVFVSVNGYGNAKSYVRARPGVKQVGDVLGREFFEFTGALIGVGFQAYDDWDRRDLGGGAETGARLAGTARRRVLLACCARVFGGERPVSAPNRRTHCGGIFG